MPMMRMGRWLGFAAAIGVRAKRDGGALTRTRNTGKFFLRRLRGGEPFHDLVRDIEIRVDGLDILVILEGLDKP